MKNQSIFDVANSLKNRPLFVCDIDEVVLEFLTPFQNFLKSQGYELRADKFALHGNIYNSKNDKAADNQSVSDFIEAFYSEQSKWQTPLFNVENSLSELADELDIIFLTAMPPVYFGQRKQLLESFELHYPLIATEDAKGPVIKALHNDREHPTFFIDDMIYNHHSVAQHMPDTNCISIMANQEFKAMAPPLGDDIYDANSWTDVTEHIFKKLK